MKKIDDISSDTGSDKKYSAAKNRNQDETEEDDVSDMEDFQPNKKDIPKKINSKLIPGFQTFERSETTKGLEPMEVLPGTSKLFMKDTKSISVIYVIRHTKLEII